MSLGMPTVIEFDWSINWLTLPYHWCRSFWN